MVDQSELSFRMLTRKYGADLVYTQMFNANSFISSKDHREVSFTTCNEDRPLIVQFCGNNPETILKAAKYVEDRCDAVDINLGCPQDIARRGRYGAYLMEELDLLTDIVSLLSRNLKIPVTCKTRIYKDFDKSVKLCETLVNAGASLLTIHGRTRDEKGHNVRNADWKMISKLKKHFHDRVPIIANGGIETYEDIGHCLSETGCDGVMTSEAILENPALFSQTKDETGVHLSQLDLADEYLSFCLRYEGSQVKATRSHLMKMLYCYLVHHTDVRMELAASPSIEDMVSLSKRLRLLVEAEAADYSARWYRRHRSGDTDAAAADEGPQQQQHQHRSSLQRSLDRAADKLWDNFDEDESCVCSLFGSE